MDYIELTVTAPPDAAEILIAELGELPFDTFEETATGFNAYCTEDAFSEEATYALIAHYSQQWPDLDASHRVITRQNWNAEWEKNFQPLLLADGRVSVRAPFHPKPESADYDIVIMPRMSFGTGHHNTTALMLEAQLTLDHAGKRVLDMGCGTGILAIFAAQLGARQVVAIDTEPWTVENARDNAAENHVADRIAAYLGDASLLSHQAPFDLVLANINRNVLLEDIPAYVRVLTPGGPLVLSGFYEADLPLIRQTAEAAGLRYESHRVRHDWTAAIFRL
ncbi:MAG TPA: 50S ribosomal protein L11 methyltransferase [bacterium]|nr:50S ribosomal protein L11 methyltransferase [bacterium]